MAKKFVRGVTGVKNIENFDISLTNVNDIISDGQHSYIHTKNGESESYYNLTDNINAISSSNNDLINVTTSNNTTTLNPKHDAQKEQLLESTRSTVNISHGTNATTGKTTVDTNPQKVLEHENLIAGNNLTKTSSGNTTTLKVSDYFTNKVNKMDTTLNELKSEGLKPYKELGFNINDNIPELFTNFRETTWGVEGTVTNDDGVYSATITTANQGMVTNVFSSTKSKVVVRLKGNVTVKSVGVNVQFITTKGVTTNKNLALITGKTTLDETITFDPSSLAVYDDAKSDSFQIIINSKQLQPSDDPTGTITINTCSIKEADSLQLKETYDPNLRKFLNNMASNLETLSEESKNNSLTLISPNNKKYRVLINNSGELYTKLISFTKVLYMGNSILAGANTDGTHGRPFGLGATSKEQSLEYKLNKLLGISGEENSTLKHDAAFEHSENDTDAQQFINSLSECMTSDTDLVIVQIADNVNNTLRYQTFTNNFDALIKKLQSINPNATLLLAGAWYDSYQLTQWLSNYADEHGLLFTNLRALNVPKNYTKEGLTQTYDDGTSRLIKKEWETHPGDDGYTAMAQAIYNTLTN